MENSTARYSTPASRAISISTHLTQICMNKPRTIDEQLNKSEHIQFPAPAAAFFRFYPSAAEGISGSGIKGPCRHGRGQADLIPLWLGNLCKLATIYIYVRVHVGSARRWWRVGRFWWYPHAPLLMMWGNCAIFCGLVWMALLLPRFGTPVRGLRLREMWDLQTNGMEKPFI